MFCTECGATNKPGAQFCVGCGANIGDAPATPAYPVQQAAPVQPVCTSCGAQMSAGMMFCDTCGTRAGQPAAQAQTFAQPQYQQPMQQPQYGTEAVPAYQQPGAQFNTPQPAKKNNLMVPIAVGVAVVAIAAVLLFLWPGFLVNNSGDNDIGTQISTFVSPSLDIPTTTPAITPSVTETAPPTLVIETTQPTPAIETTQPTPSNDPLFTSTPPPTPMLPTAMEMPSGGGDLSVETGMEVVFTPNATGDWTIFTSNNNGDPHLILYNHVGNAIGMDDDSGGNGNALIEVELHEGYTYSIVCGSYENSPATYTLTASMSGAPSSNSGNQGIQGNSGNTGVADGLEWWDGEWYGLFSVYETNSAYSSLMNTFEDAHAVIRMNANGTGTVYLWSDSYELGTVEISVDLNSGGAMGIATSTGGTLFNYPVKYADWALNPSQGNFVNTLVIHCEFTDTDGDWFNYYVVLRPWGMTWDALVEMGSSIPPYYNDWYVRVAANMTMLEALREAGGINHSALS